MSKDELKKICPTSEVAYELDMFHQDAYDGESTTIQAPTDHIVDEVDDLFDNNSACPDQESV